MFRKLFGKKQQPPDPQQLLETIVAFIQAETWGESQRIVEVHPELLSNQADALIEELAQAQDNENARRLVAEHKALLRRCREVSVAQAFAEMGKQSGPRRYPPRKTCAPF